jgi:hypothetical protein
MQMDLPCLENASLKRKRILGRIDDPPRAVTHESAGDLERSAVRISF